jgi:tRNA 2-thiocytidine biosynthesis protein TtcA
MFTALANVVPSHLLDRSLYPFTTLQRTGTVNPGGDKAFDDEDDCAPPPSAVVRLQPDL